MSKAPVALITGGARGIGLGIARCLGEAGYRLAVNGVRPEEQAEESLAELKTISPAVVYCQGDVSSAADRQAIVERVRSEFGRLDVLINNAGITSPGRKDILEAEEESFDRVFGVNLKGPFFLTKLCANWMVEQQAAGAELSPAIVNISSISAEFVSVNRGDYCLTKAATGMATKLWAARLAEFGIPVYEVQPGVIKSDMTSGVTEKYDRLIAEGLTLEPRWGEPQDVGKAVSALVRAEIPYATGQVLYVDGGMRIRRM